MDLSRFKGHTPGPWEWARGKYTREEFLAYCAEAWDRTDPNPFDDHLNVIQADDDGQNLTIAILGNGPTAHINGPLIAAVPDLLAEVKRLTEEQPAVCVWTRTPEHYVMGCEPKGWMAFMFGDYCSYCGKRIQIDEEDHDE